MRAVSVWVFPVPGPADTAVTRAVVHAAARCSSFRPSAGAGEGGNSGWFQRQLLRVLVHALRRLGQAEQADLPAKSSDFSRGKQLDHAILPVESGLAHHFPRTQTAQALLYPFSCDLSHMGKRRVAQDIEFRPQLTEQTLILLLHAPRRRAHARRRRNHLRQGREAFKGLFPLGPRRAVGQFLHAVFHADCNFSAANRAFPAVLKCLGRGQAHAAVPVAVQMIFSLFREKLNRPAKTVRVAPLDRVRERIKAPVNLEQVGLAAKLAGGVRI